MKPFNTYELRAVLQGHKQRVIDKIEKYTNDEIMANNIDVLVENIYQEFFIEPVEIFDEDFSKRRVEQKKIMKYLDSFDRSFYGHDSVMIDGVELSFFYPYIGDSKLFECQASTFSLSGYPEIILKSDVMCLQISKTLQEMNREGSKEEIEKNLAHQLKSITDAIGYANNDVNAFNSSLRADARGLIEKRRSKVQAFFDISTMFQVPIEKTEHAKTHLPLTRRISPITKKYQSESYYTISDKDYIDIISSLKHICSTYERTPSSYKSLQEEDLRNTLLAALNSSYLGRATGETFRNHGKTDICIEADDRAAFVAECKMWTGKKAVSKAIYQLDSYLTWRDCKTALICFVRRKDFLSITETLEATLREISSINSVVPIDKNEYKCVLHSEANPGLKIEMRVLLFNMYAEDK